MNVLISLRLAVEATALDHRTLSLAFALQEGTRVNVWRNGLHDLGLPVGPWRDEAKRAARQGLSDGHGIAVPRHGSLGASEEAGIGHGRGLHPLAR